MYIIKVILYLYPTVKIKIIKINKFHNQIKNLNLFLKKIKTILMMKLNKKFFFSMI